MLLENSIARLAAALLLTAALPLAAQSTSQLKSDFQAEASRLDAKIDEYFDAREREDDALKELSRASRRLDKALADPNSGRAELVDLDVEVRVARERAVALTEETADRRRKMFQSMERLADMVRELERQDAGRGGGIAGSWQVEVKWNDVWGVLELRQEGTFVIGSYQLSNGAAGSLKGTFAGQRLDLEFIDSERGTVSDADGELDPETGQINGTWNARELAAGRPTAGEWTARRIEE